MRGKGAFIRELLERRVGDISLNELRFLKGEQRNGKALDERSDSDRGREDDARSETLRSEGPRERPEAHPARRGQRRQQWSCRIDTGSDLPSRWIEPVDKLGNPASVERRK